MISIYVNEGGASVFEIKHGRVDRLIISRDDLENIVLIHREKEINLKELLETYNASVQSRALVQES